MARLIGRYEVLAELGRGGFGHVYKCLDPTLGTPVAIKTLTADDDAGMLVRFRNEAATSRKLTHPNIVTIYDFGDQDGVPYIVMELLDGQDLHKVIETRAPLTLLQKVEIMSQIAAGLGHAHTNGVVHRDVKPANVMLLRDRSVKIMDFGIAMITQSTHSRLTPRGAMIGTFRYMAPEQFRGGEPDARSDIFAYGLICFELLSGVHPFQAPEAAALMYNILTTEPVAIGELVPDCPDGLQAVISRLLAKDPDMRYQSLDDAMFDIGPALLKLREQRAEELLAQARLEKSQDQLEKARILIHEVLSLAPGHKAGREMREQLQLEQRRRAVRPRVEEILRKGKEALASGNPANAAQHFESAIRLDPGDTAVQDMLRDARVAAEKLKDAQRIVMEAETALRRGDHAGAALLALEALDLVPTFARARQLVEQAEAAIAQEQQRAHVAEQVARARRFIEIRSWDAAAILLAELERDHSDTPEIQTLSEKLDAGRQKEEAERALASGLAAARQQFQTGNPAGALKELEALTARFPESAEAASMFSTVKLEIDAQQHREFVRSKLEEARALAVDHQYEAAVHVFNVALSRYPADPELQRERRAMVVAQQEAARRASIEKTKASAAELRSQGRLADAVKLLEGFLGSQGAESSLEQLRDSIAQEQEAARRAAELREFVRRANELIAKGQAHTVTVLLANSPGHLKENSEVTRLVNAAEAQQKAEEELHKAQEEERRARERKQSAFEALSAETNTLCGQGRFDAALEAVVGFETRFGADERAAQIRKEIGDRRLEAQVQDLCARAQALLASEPAKAAALLDAAPENLRASAEVRALHQAAQSAVAAAQAASRAKAAAEAAAAQEAERKLQARRAVAGRVRELMNRHRYDEAGRALEEGLAADRGDLELIDLRGEVAEHHRKWEAEQDAARTAQENRRREQMRRVVVGRVRELLDAHRYDEAGRALEDGLAADRGSAELLALRSEIAERQRQRQAEQAAAAAAAEASRREQARQAAIARVHELVNGKRFDQAAGAVAEALSANPGNPELLQLNAEVEQLIRQWQDEQAAAAAKAEALRREQSRQSAITRIRELLNNHRYDEAARAVAEALSADRDHPELLQLNSEVEPRRRQWQAEQAAAAAAAEAQRREQSRQSAIARIRELLSSQRYDDAARAVQDALSADRDHPELLQMSSEVEQRRRQWQVEQASAQRRAVISRARELLGRHQFAEAGRALEGALSADPMSPDLLELQTEIERLHGEWQTQQAESEIGQALAKARELLAAQPAQAVVQLEALGRKHAGRGDIQSALDEAREAVAGARRRQVLGEIEKLCAKEDFETALGRVNSLEPDASGEAARARQRVLALQEQSEHKRAAEAIQAAAKDAHRPKVALSKLEKLKEPLRSRAEVQAAIQEYRDRLHAPAVSKPAAPSPAAHAPAAPAPVPSEVVPEKAKFPMHWVAAGAALVAIVGVGTWYLTHRDTTQPQVTLLQVEIRTDPAGAKVSVGDRSCQTPNCQLQLPPGSYQVSATRDGYQPALQSLTIQAGKRPDPVSMTLKPVPVVVAAGRPAGTLVVRTGIPDVLVLVDNVGVGRTDPNGMFTEPIEAAPHSVRVEKAGFQVVPEKRVTIADRQSVQVAFTLAAQNARLDLQGAPAGVEISANGVALGRTTGGAFSSPVLPGLRTLRMNTGSSIHEIARAFEPGQTVTLDWSTVAPAGTTAGKVDPAEQEWAAVRESTDPALVQAFLDKYANSAFAAEAQSRIDALVWSRTNQNDAQALRAYVSRFPAGPHVRDANARIAELADQLEKQALAQAQAQAQAQALAQAQAKEAAERLAQEKQAQQTKEQPVIATAPKGKENPLLQQQNQAIRDALGQFNQAFEHKSQRELRLVWLKPLPDYLDAMTQSGQNSFLAVLRPLADAVVANNAATILCELTTRTTFRGQARPPNSATVKVSLTNAGGRWQIVELGKP